MTWKPFLSNSLLNTSASSILIASMGSLKILRYVSRLETNFEKVYFYPIRIFDSGNCIYSKPIGTITLPAGDVFLFSPMVFLNIF